MKVSYGSKIALHGPDGTYYDQRITMTSEDLEKINRVLYYEILRDYIEYRKYASSYIVAKMYLTEIKGEGDILYLKMTQTNFLRTSTFKELNARILPKRNTYIKIVDEK